MNDPLDHMWQCLQADSAESADNPLLEKRLMNEMNQPTKTTPRWRKYAIAAGVMLGVLSLGTGIAVATGYNPFKTYSVTLDQGHVTVVDENGTPVPPEALNIEVKEENGQTRVTARIEATPGTTVKVKAGTPASGK